jgi:uncharacterized membrane protein YgcG
MNPLKLDEPRFLVLYVPLLVLTFIGSVALRRRRRLPGGVPLPPDMDLKRHQFQAFLPMALVLALGLVKVGVEMHRDRPVGLLVFILLGAAIASVIVWSGGESRLSRRGEAVLAALRWSHRALLMPVGSEGGMRLVSPGNLALVVGLYGTAALASSQFGGFRAYLQSSPAGMSGSSLDSPDFENSYNSYSDYSDYGSTDRGGGGEGGGGSDGGGGGGGGGGGD